MHSQALKYSQMGKEKYLANQAERFDRSYINPHSVGVYATGAIIVLGGCFIIYELIALGTLTILNKCSKEEASRGFPPPI
jgi:hypothetical protein